MPGPVRSYEDLEVYQKLLELHLEVNQLTMEFPKFELYELGSQLRRSSNSAPANIAEGWGNKHLNIYLEALSRGLGEIRETKHHLRVAHHKAYLSEMQYAGFARRYDECSRMLRGLERSLRQFAR